jgi:hypothetical protein
MRPKNLSRSMSDFEIRLVDRAMIGVARQLRDSLSLREAQLTSFAGDTKPASGFGTLFSAYHSALPQAPHIASVNESTSGSVGLTRRLSCRGRRKSLMSRENWNAVPVRGGAWFGGAVICHALRALPLENLYNVPTNCEKDRRAPSLDGNTSSRIHPEVLAFSASPMPNHRRTQTHQ